MKVTVQLDYFNDMKVNVNTLVYNIKSEFCNLYVSSDLQESIDVKIVDQHVFNQVNQTGIGRFIAKKDDVPFEVIIYWEKNQLEVKSVNNHKQADLEFYVYRCIEVCRNFAVIELIADEGSVHELGTH